jgi:hypothetical protein
MGLIPTSDNYCSFKTYQTYFGDYIVGIATTWYVIFTYFILKANVDIRNLKVNPSLKIQWIQDSDLDQNQVNDYEYISQHFRSILSQKSDIDYGDKRYVKLGIQNTKDIDVGTLSIMLEVDCVGVEGLKKTLNLDINNPDINRDNPFLVTILDLACVPENISIRLTLKSFVYTPKNSREKISDYSGNNFYEVRGICSYEQILIPHQDK